MAACLMRPAAALELQKQQFSDEAIFSAVVEPFRKTLMYRFNPAASAERLPILVLGPALKFGERLRSATFTHLTVQELVEQQEAVFILITRSHPDLERNALYVYFEIPSNASNGVMRVFPKNGVLVTEVNDAFRSSSGARVVYGELYEHAICRDGSEMAYRWNQTSSSGRGGRCPEARFSEFDAWLRLSREMKKR